jgi:transposase
MDKRVIKERPTRRRHSAALKRELIERSLQPGASVAALAQEHGINANLLFNWRRLHLAQQMAAGQPPADAEPATVLLPVTVEEPIASPAAPRACAPATPTPQRTGTGVIEVEIGAALVRLRGAVDEASVRCVLQALLELQ